MLKLPKQKTYLSHSRHQKTTQKPGLYSEPSLDSSEHLMLSCIEEVQSYVSSLSDCENKKSMLENKIEELESLLRNNRNSMPIILAIKSCEVFMNILENKASFSIYDTPEKQKFIEKPKKQDKTVPKQLSAPHKHAYFEIMDTISELSSICEQIPQLQTFRRTLILTTHIQVPNQQSYLQKKPLRKIVDVLIELHHKVEELLGEQPKQLAARLQSVNIQCQILEKQMNQFKQIIQQILAGNIKNIQPIVFNQRINKSPQSFRKVQKVISEVSELLCRVSMEESIKQCQGLHTIFDMINLYRQFVIQSLELGKTPFRDHKKQEQLNRKLEKLQSKWAKYRQSDKTTQVENKIRETLQECFDIFYDQLEELAIIKQKQQEKQDQTKQLLKNIHSYQKQIEQVRIENDQLKEKIFKLTRGHQLNNTNLQNSQLREIREEHQYALQQKMRLEQELVYFRQKIELYEKKDRISNKSINSMTETIKNQVEKIHELESQLKKLREDIDESKFQQLQELNKKNAELEDIISMIEQQRFSWNEVSSEVPFDQNQMRSIHGGGHGNTEQLVKEAENQTRMINELKVQNKEKQQLIQKLLAKTEGISQRSQFGYTSHKQKLNQYQIENKQLSAQIINKDQKITQLNHKLCDLNQGFKTLLVDYQKINEEHKLKKEASIKQGQLRQSTDKQSEKQFTDTKKQLEKAILKIKETEHLVKELERQIKRRDIIIKQLNEIVTGNDSDGNRCGRCIKSKKKIDLLEQKIRSLEEVTEILTEQCERLQQKFKVEQNNKF